MRESSCYSDKMCLVCLSYYLGTNHADGGDKHDADIQELVELRIGKMVLDEYDCRNQHEMCGGKTVDGGVLRKALHNCKENNNRYESLETSRKLSGFMCLRMMLVIRRL